jgi:membrane-bound serine protease (ClpP class)
MPPSLAIASGPARRLRAWRTVSLLAGVLLAWTSALAQPAPTAPRAEPADAAPSVIPAYRQADSVVVITIQGPIDAITAMSVRRRIAMAEDLGADAMVFDINSPGGEVGAVLEITNAIKGSAIDNTVAWVNPDAYSGGAIIALACREIVTASPASMGDAFPVTMTPVAGQNRMGLRGLTPDERTKILPVLLADVTDSARRAGWDEYMVQAVVIDGVELWWVEDTRTGQRLAVNADEYKMLFGRPPVRGKPLLAGVTGGVRERITSESEQIGADDAQPAPDAPADAGDSPAEPDADRPPTLDERLPAPPASVPAPPTVDPDDDAFEPAGDQAFRPASESLRDIAEEFASPERSELRLERASQRPVLTPADSGHFRDLGYLTDGTAPIVMRQDQMEAFGFSNGQVRDDQDLSAYFGALELVRVDENWSERLVRFLTGGMVRGVLIVIMLLALFIEMMSPGLTIPGAVAAAALVTLLAPPALIGMAGWWEFAAIGAGLVLLAIEIFVLPGFGLFGILGVVALFGGLLGTFVPAGGALGNPNAQEELLRGATILLLSAITAGIGMYLIGRYFNRVPLLDRLVLGPGPGDEDEEAVRVDAEMLHAAARAPAPVIAVGDLGVAATALRPAGVAEFNDRLVDVVSDLGLIDPGTPVRVERVEGFRIVVVEDTASPPGLSEETA